MLQSGGCVSNILVSSTIALFVASNWYFYPRIFEERKPKSFSEARLLNKTCHGNHDESLFDICPDHRRWFFIIDDSMLSQLSVSRTLCLIV